MHVDWATISSLATAAGTLVLAVATFAAVRSANQSARTAEHSLLANLRPLFVPSQLQDGVQKVLYADGKWLRVPGGCAAVDVENGVIYLAASLRNVGTGIGIIHGWRFYPDRDPRRPPPELHEFHPQTRDLYLPPGYIGFWQAAFRDQDDPQYAEACKVVTAKGEMTIDLLYGDFEGGQRVITTFGLVPRDDGAWLLSAGQYWNLDRPDPRVRPDVTSTPLGRLGGGAALSPPVTQHRSDEEG